MHESQKKVEEFHRAMGQTVGDAPAIRDAELRAALILEEAVETVVAIVGSGKAGRMLHFARQVLMTKGGTAPDLVEAVDGLCDLKYVLDGTAVAFGVDLEPFFDEVHRTNMAKAGGSVRADGKREKPPGWQPPRIRELLEVAREHPRLYAMSSGGLRHLRDLIRDHVEVGDRGSVVHEGVYWDRESWPRALSGIDRVLALREVPAAECTEKEEGDQ